MASLTESLSSRHVASVNRFFEQHQADRNGETVVDNENKPSKWERLSSAQPATTPRPYRNPFGSPAVPTTPEISRRISLRSAVIEVQKQLLNLRKNNELKGEQSASAVTSRAARGPNASVDEADSVQETETKQETKSKSPKAFTRSIPKVFAPRSFDKLPPQQKSESELLFAYDDMLPQRSARSTLARSRSSSRSSTARNFDRVPQVIPSSHGRSKQAQREAAYGEMRQCTGTYAGWSGSVTDATMLESKMMQRVVSRSAKHGTYHASYVDELRTSYADTPTSNSASGTTPRAKAPRGKLSFDSARRALDWQEDPGADESDASNSSAGNGTVLRRSLKSGSRRYGTPQGIRKSTLPGVPMSMARPSSSGAVPPPVRRRGPGGARRSGPGLLYGSAAKHRMLDSYSAHAEGNYSNAVRTHTP